MEIKVKGIARYAHLIKPSSPKGSEKLKYSLQVLLHKTDPQVKEIQSKIEEAIKNQWPSGKPQKNFHVCLKDLAVKEPENDVLKDYIAVKIATSAEFDRPILVDQSLSAIIDPGVQITGQEVIVSAKISAYVHALNSGVAAYLQGTCVTDTKGSLPIESLSAKPSAESMFGDVVTTNQSTSVATPPSAPTPPTAPDKPVYEMTEKANGATRDAFIAQGWTDSMLIEHGYMKAPNGVTPSFG